MFVVLVRPENHGDFHRQSPGGNLRRGRSNRRVASFENRSIVHTCQCVERFSERTEVQSYFLPVKLESQVGWCALHISSTLASGEIKAAESVSKYVFDSNYSILL